MYKPSGIDWFGEKLRHWDVSFLNKFTNVHFESTTSNSNKKNWNVGINKLQTINRQICSTIVLK